MCKISIKMLYNIFIRKRENTSIKSEGRMRGAWTPHSMHCQRIVFVVLGTWSFSLLAIFLTSLFYLAFSTFVVCNCPFRVLLFWSFSCYICFILRVSFTWTLLNLPSLTFSYFPSLPPPFSSHTFTLEAHCSADRVHRHSKNLVFVSECDRDPSARGGLRLSVANRKMVEHQEDHSSSSLHTTTSTS